jgi:glycosyltransferase involved in cell wall biosynthesis
VAVTCFVSYEVHPTTIGGCGVLIHHAADVLLAAGHEVVLLLDVPSDEFRRFVDKDRLTFARPEHCRAYRVDDLCEDFAHGVSDIPCVYQWKSLRFAHALTKLLAREAIDFVEFFEYCGSGYYSFVQRLYALDSKGPVLGSRLHGSMEVLDRHGQGAVKDADRLVLHGLERRALALSEAVLAPSRTYYERYYKDLYNLEPGRVVVSSPPKQAFPRVTRRPAPAGPFSILFIGRMFHLKGVDQLVHAAVMLMKERPRLEFNVDLVGYDSDESPIAGGYTKYLKTLIPERLRSRFVFTGHLSHEQVSKRLDRELFAVFPNRIESFCYALHEVYDAGIPVVINDLPALRDFFEDARNAIVYDGSTQGLLASMKRMIDDDALCDRLCRPYPVADHPIGEFYANPAARAPLALATGEAEVREPLVIVLCKQDDFAGCAALESLTRQTTPAARVLCLVPAQPNGEETLWWLGRAWHVRATNGQPVETSDVLTTDALAVIESDDGLDPSWIESCMRALSRRRAMAFAGSWPRQGGRIVPLALDVAPELVPFTRPGELARVLVRTQRGILLADLLDPSLGALGHLGYLWQAIEQWGHGVLLPTPLVDTIPTPALAIDIAAIRALLMRFGAPFAERLALVAGLLTESTGSSANGANGSSSLAQAPPTVEQKVALADELGGRTLARLALKKLARRVVSPAPPNR